MLFFHDEAVALAAGHRPCALCRRGSYEDYRRAWAAGLDTAVPLAKEMDRRLHGERLVRGTHRRRLHPSTWPVLPAGTFVAAGGEPVLVLDDRIVPWTVAGIRRAAAPAPPRTGRGAHPAGHRRRPERRLPPADRRRGGAL